MWTIWGIWLAALLILALLRPLTSSDDTTQLVMILAHALASIVLFSANRNGPLGIILSAALLARLTLVMWDSYLGSAFPVVHSGYDSEMFHYWALAVADDPSLLMEDIQGGVFSKATGLLFYLAGDVRFFVQYTNALLGVSTVYLIHQMLLELELKRRTILWVSGVAAVMPTLTILSALFLRESVITFLTAASFLLFTRWFRSGHLAEFFGSLALILLAAAFHSGILVLVVGYLVVALLAQPGSDRLKGGTRLIPAMIVAVGALYLALETTPDLFLGKFEQIDSESDLFVAVNRRLGGSAYLTDLTVGSIPEFFLYSPLRAVYFLASPVPWDWRGLTDAVTFLLDSSFYLTSLALGVTAIRRAEGNRRWYLVAIVILVVLSSLVFGAGVGNSGTALRHRGKLFILFAALLAIALDGKKTRFNSGAQTPDRGTPVRLDALNDNGAPGVRQ